MCTCDEIHFHYLQSRKCANWEQKTRTPCFATRIGVKPFNGTLKDFMYFLILLKRERMCLLFVLERDVYFTSRSYLVC